MYPGLTVVGSVALNRAVGGLNPDAVEAAAKLSARVVWMPTFDADFAMKGSGSRGIRLTNDAGDLRAEVREILDVVRRYDMVLASGHVSPAEAVALFRAAKANGIGRMMATHPGGVATKEELREMASLGAYIEYTFLSCMPSRAGVRPADLVGALRGLAVDHCVVTTDFGQWMNPPPAEGMRMAIAALLEAGMGPEEVSTLVKLNPARLLGTD